MAEVLTISQYLAKPNSYTGTNSVTIIDSAVNITNNLLALKNMGSKLWVVYSNDSILSISSSQANTYAQLLNTKLGSTNLGGTQVKIKVNDYTGILITTIQSLSARLDGSANILDSQNNINSNLSLLKGLVSNNKISEISINSTTANFYLAGSTLTTYSYVFDRIKSNYTISFPLVYGNNEIGAAVVASTVASHIPTNFSIVDSGEEITKYLPEIYRLEGKIDYLRIGKGGAITLSDSDFILYKNFLETKINSYQSFASLKITTNIIENWSSYEALFNKFSKLEISDLNSIDIKYDQYASFKLLANKITTAFHLEIYDRGLSSLEAIELATLNPGKILSLNISDSVENIAINLVRLGYFFPGKISRIDLTSPFTPILKIDAGVLLSDINGVNCLSKINSNFEIELNNGNYVTLEVTPDLLQNNAKIFNSITSTYSLSVSKNNINTSQKGVSVADANTLLSRVDVSSIKICDTSSNIAENLSKIYNWGDKLTELYTSDFSTIVVKSAADFNNYFKIISKITDTWNVGVSLQDFGSISAAASLSSAAGRMQSSVNKLSVEDSADNITSLILKYLSQGYYYNYGRNLDFNNSVKEIKFSEEAPLVKLDIKSLAIWNNQIAPLIPTSEDYVIKFNEPITTAYLEYIQLSQSSYSHLYSFSISVSDASDLTSHILQIHSLSPKIEKIYFTPSESTPIIDLDYQFFSEISVFEKINNPYILNITNLTIADISSALENTRVDKLYIADSGYAISNNLARLNNHIDRISLIDIKSPDEIIISQSELNLFTNLLAKIKNSPNDFNLIIKDVSIDYFEDVLNISAVDSIEVLDTSANIFGNINYIFSNRERVGKISTIDNTDITITESQASAFNQIVSKFTNTINIAKTTTVNSSPNGLVTVTGTAKQGETLTVSNSISDNDGVGTITYRWYASGSNASIATGTSYTLTEAHIGKTITVKAEYTDNYGTAETVTSTATDAVSNINDAPSGLVIISGNLIQGQRLTASNTLGDADGLGTISYQWKAAGSAISGATSSTYTLTRAEVGKKITVVASYTDGHGTLEVVSSTETSAIATNNKTPTGAVTITGTAKQGQKLSVANTIKDADGLGAISYQWKADGAAINGVTGTSLTLTQSQVGKAISVTASYVDKQGNDEAVSSNQTTSVANLNDLPTGSVTITGTAAQGQTLTASNTLADADGLGNITYTWMSGKTVLGTGSSYSLAQSHVGQAITVVARYVDVLGTPESKTSVATAKVANVNDAPTVANPIADQTAAEGVAFNFTLPTNVFTDLDKDKLIITASSLPSWLKFASGKFTGTPTYTASESTYSIGVIANDGKGGTVTDTFNLSVSNVSTITGTAKADVIEAGSGGDTISGLAGNDLLNGGSGDDVIDGGLGNDILTGGIGADSFKFTSALKGNLDKITDFTCGTDKLVLDDAIFTKLLSQTDQLASGDYFKSGQNNAPIDNNDYLIFNTATGALFYDADGSGKSIAVQFATLTGVSDLSASDFWIV
jgi:Ca2+-binding RTX toxin-like protein